MYLALGIGLAGRACARHPACLRFCLCPLRPWPGPEPAEGHQGLRQDRLGVVDPPPPAQPFGVVEAELCPLEWPLVPSRIGERCLEMRSGLAAAGVLRQPAAARQLPGAEQNQLTARLMQAPPASAGRPAWRSRTVQVAARTALEGDGRGQAGGWGPWAVRGFVRLTGLA